MIDLDDISDEIVGDVLCHVMADPELRAANNSDDTELAIKSVIVAAYRTLERLGAPTITRRHARYEHILNELNDY